MAATLLRIAHGYGNRRARIAQAQAAKVDRIEADLRWWDGQIWVRHEHRIRRLPWLPLLYNKNLRGIHRAGPWAMPLGSLWLRLDLARLSFTELLGRVTGPAGLMLDLKRDSHSPETARRFVAAVFAELDSSRFSAPVDFCGAWQYLDIVRDLRPAQSAHYSVDSAGDWDAAEARLGGPRQLPKITLKLSLASEERRVRLRQAGVPFVVWDVATRAEADHAITLGAEGLIADDLAMLSSLAGLTVARPGGSQ